MPRPTPSKFLPAEGRPDAVAAFGGWLFKRRTVIPLPIAAALLLIPAPAQPSPVMTLVAGFGVPVVLMGEAIRLWAVHHIGVISRTRSDRLGPLVNTGPFSLVRNPLYLGNILLWAGFALSAGLAWLAPGVVLLLAVEYQAIVRWEEQLLVSRIGDDYRHYTASVPRWIPRLRVPARLAGAAPFSWRDTLYHERGTLIAIGAGYLLLALKARW